MANENQIIIRKEYFDNINTVITSINSFFSSDFKNKNFPVVDETFQTDTVIMEIISWLNNVEPSWIDNYDKIEEVLNGIIEATKDIEDEDKFTYLVNNNNTVILDHINAFIGYKVLQFIGNNFEDFNTLINGIYSFELFTKPSQYKECIDIFSQDIPLTELDSVLGDNKYVLFSDEKYISGIFSNPQINLPETFKLDTELSRFSNGTDLTNIEILVDDSVQEAVVTNAFADKKPEHIKYNESDDTFKLSKQYKSAVDSFISDIKKCDTTEDLAKFFSDEKIGKKDYASLFAHNVMPFILAKVFNNTTKYPFDTYDVDEVGKYIKSYKSIVDKNNGAKRFINYDMFSTFKIDKESTINFLSSFLKIELYNNKSEVISNNILLILFNIFDSRIYLNTLYNLIPDKVKKDKYQTSDIFVKAVRAKINAHSRVANVYKPDTDTGNNTTTEVLEYTDIMMKQMGDMSTTDMAYCEQYRGLVMSEIDCIGDVLYNMNLSPIKIDRYIGESYDVISPYIQEGFISNVIDKLNNKYDANQLLTTMKLVENRTKTKLPEEYKKYMIDSVNGKYTEIVKNDKYVKLYWDKSKLNRYNIKANLIDIIKNKSINDHFYIGYIECYDDKSEDDIETPIYIHTNGRLYTKFFSKNHETLEPIESGYSDIYNTLKHMNSIKMKNVQKTDLTTNVDVSWCGIFEADHVYNNIPLFLNTTNDVTLYEYCYYKSQIYMIRDSSSDYFGEALCGYHNGSYTYYALHDTLNRKFPNEVPPYVEGKHNESRTDVFDYIKLKSIYTTKGDTICEFKTVFGNNIVDISLESGQITVNGEVFNEPYVQEVETGDIPSYMRDRINLSDSTGTSPNTSIVDMQLPPDVPMNPYEDLTMSIDTKLSNGNSLDDSLGIGYHDTTKKSDGKIVYNITNNYTNSFNRDNSRHDSSTGKTITITNTNSHNDTSTNKRSNINTGKAPNNNMRKNSLNNYNNGIVSPDDSKDDRDDITIEHLTLSSGYSVQEVMVFLESEEPPSDGANDAGKPPKSDLLTASMDVDRKTLSAQQGAKKKVQKAVNTAKAVMKPVTRTKKWLTGILDSLIKRDENKVKAEIIENPSYRTALYKAGRLAIKLGLTGIAFTINSYLGAAYVAINVAKVADKERLKKEVQEEFTTELEILDDKIERASREDSPESRKALWQMMRLRSKLQKHALDAPRSRIKHYRGIY